MKRPAPPPEAEGVLTHLCATDPWAAGWIVGAVWNALTPKQRAEVWALTEQPRTHDIDGNPRDAAGEHARIKQDLAEWLRAQGGAR